MTIVRNEVQPRKLTEIRKGLPDLMPTHRRANHPSTPKFSARAPYTLHLSKATISRSV